MVAERGDDAGRAVADADALNGVRRPALLARKFLGQPVGQRAGAGIADPLALELISCLPPAGRSL
jgi:hypothetical protein